MHRGVDLDRRPQQFRFCCGDYGPDCFQAGWATREALLLPGEHVASFLSGLLCTTTSETTNANTVNGATRNRNLAEVDAGLCTFVVEAGTSLNDYGKQEDDLVLENANDKTVLDAARPGQWVEAVFLSREGGRYEPNRL